MVGRLLVWLLAGAGYTAVLVYVVLWGIGAR